MYITVAMMTTTLILVITITLTIAMLVMLTFWRLSALHGMPQPQVLGFRVEACIITESIIPIPPLYNYSTVYPKLLCQVNGGSPKSWVAFGGAPYSNKD